MNITKLMRFLGPRTYAVTAHGAVPDFAVACLAAFQTAYAKVTSRGHRVLVPAPDTEPSVGYPLYLLANGAFIADSIGTKSAKTKGGKTLLQYRIGLQEGPLLIPHGHWVEGNGSYSTNAAKPVGSEVSLTAGATRRLEVTALTISGTTATATARNADVSIGSVVQISGTTVASGFNYNGSHTVTAVNAAAGTFQFSIPSSTPTVAANTALSPDGNASYVIGVIKTATRPRVVQALPSDSGDGAGAKYGDTTGWEQATINGRDVPGAIGFWSDSIQELSALKDACILGCQTSVKIVAAATITPANFKLERLNCINSSLAGNQGNGIDIFATKFELDVATMVNAYGASIPTMPSAYVFRGQDIKASNLHFERADWGVTVGGPASGIGIDINDMDALIEIDGAHGFNDLPYPGLMGAGRVLGNSANVLGIKFKRLSINVANTGTAWAAGQTIVAGNRRSFGNLNIQVKALNGGITALADAPPLRDVGEVVTGATDGIQWEYVHMNNLMVDEVNDIIIPATTSALKLGEYAFEGTRGLDSLVASQSRPVFTTYYDGRVPKGAVKFHDLTASSTVARNFTAGALADIIQLRVPRTSGVLDVSALSNPLPGARVFFDVQPMAGGQARFKHTPAGTSTQFVCSGGADLTSNATTGGRYWATYGGDPAYPTKWLIEVA
jgi:hypothetical protein